MENFLGLKAGEGFEAFDHAGEDEAADDEERDADDEEAPAGDAAHVFVIKLFPIHGGGVEVVEEVVGEGEVHDGGEAEGAEEEFGGAPEKFAEFGFFSVRFDLLVDAAVVKDALVVDEGIEERGG